MALLGSTATGSKPPPAPKLNLPKASTTTAANPRGTALAPPPKPTINDKAATTLGTGANPRGTAIVQPKPVVIKVSKAMPKAAKPSSHGTSWLSVITSPATITNDIGHALSGVGHTLGHIAVNVGKDLYNLPGDTLKGAEVVGKAAAADFISGLTHGHNGTMVGGPTSSGGFFNDTNLGHIADQAWRTSVIKDVATGHIDSAANKFVNHPLYTAMDFAGGLGAIGRIAGATARTGALGAKVADAASLARADREIAPGISGEQRHYSPNLLKKGAQVAAEHVQLPDAVTRRLAEHRLNRRTDDIVGINQGVHRLHEGQLMHESATALRGDGHRFRAPADRKAAGDIASLVVQGMASRKGLLDDLRSVRDSFQQTVDARQGDHASLAAASQHIDNINRFLGNPDVQAIDEIASAYVTRQHEFFDPEQQQLGLLDPTQARVAALEPAIEAGHVPGVRIADKPGEVSVRSAMLRDARRSVKYLDRQLQQTNLANVKLTSHSELDRALRDAKTQLATARAAEQRTYGILLGRHGREEPLSHAITQTVTREDGTKIKLPRTTTDRMNRYLDRTAVAQHELDQVRVALRSDRADRRAMASERLAAARDALKDAKGEARKLDRFENERLSGVVTDTEHRLKGGRYAVRRVSANEIEDRMRANGVNPQDIAYVNLKAPSEPTEVPYLSRSLSRGDSPSRSRTAKGVMRGAFKPGHTALIDSQLKSLNRIDRARGFDEFITQQAVHDDTGAPARYDKYNIGQARHDYEAQTGIPMTAVPLHSAATSARAAAKVRDLQSLIESGDVRAAEQSIEQSSKKARYGLVPTSQVERYLKHAEVDARSGHGPLGSITRTFRNTVLTFSPKWLAGNVVEAAIRSALVGAGPRDAQLAAKVLERLRSEGHHYEADRLEALLGGLHYGLAHRANERVTGAGALSRARRFDSVPGIHIARELGDAYMRGIVQPVFSFNRRIEQGFEHAVIGAHMHRQMREFGATWLQAAQHEQEWINKLAEGYTDPKLALDAGRYIHEVLGKYDRFSPAMKRYVNSIAPFAPWYFNAVRFVFLTMPAKHPLVESTMLAASRVAAQEYANRDVPHSSFFGLPVGSLLSDVKIGNNGYIDVGRYTPMGAFTDGPMNFFGSQLFPQGQGPFLATVGLDPFGRPLKMPSGTMTDTGDELAVAANELLMSLAGPLDVLHRTIADHGSTEYSGSTLWDTRLKPDTHHGDPGVLGGLERTFLPGWPTYLSKNYGGSASAGGLGSGAGETSLGSGSAGGLGSGQEAGLGSGQ